jgi:hypothetical protein
MSKVKTLQGILQTLDSIDLHLPYQGEHSRSSFFIGKEIDECWYLFTSSFYSHPFSADVISELCGEPSDVFEPAYERACMEMRCSCPA